MWTMGDGATLEALSLVLTTRARGEEGELEADEAVAGVAEVDEVEVCVFGSPYIIQLIMGWIEPSRGGRGGRGGSRAGRGGFSGSNEAWGASTSNDASKGWGESTTTTEGWGESASAAPATTQEDGGWGAEPGQPSMDAPKESNADDFSGSGGWGDAPAPKEVEKAAKQGGNAWQPEIEKPVPVAQPSAPVVKPKLTWAQIAKCVFSS